MDSQPLEDKLPIEANLLSKMCHILGFASIFASVAVWYFAGGTAEEAAHAERFGLFIGLWAPTFFILSDKYQRTRT